MKIRYAGVSSTLYEVQSKMPHSNVYFILYSIPFHSIQVNTLCISYCSKKAIYCNGCYTRHGPKDTCAITWKTSIVCVAVYGQHAKKQLLDFANKRAKKIEFGLLSLASANTCSVRIVYVFHLYTAKLTYVTCITLGYVLPSKHIHIVYIMLTMAIKSLRPLFVCVCVCVLCKYFAHDFSSFGFSHNATRLNGLTMKNSQFHLPPDKTTLCYSLVIR